MLSPGTQTLYFNGTFQYQLMSWLFYSVLYKETNEHLQNMRSDQINSRVTRYKILSIQKEN